MPQIYRKSTTNVILYYKNVILYYKNVILYHKNVMLYHKNMILYHKNVILYHKTECFTTKCNILPHSVAFFKNNPTTNCSIPLQSQGL